MANSFGTVQMVRRGGTERLLLLLLVYLIVFCLFVKVFLALSSGG